MVIQKMFELIVFPNRIYRQKSQNTNKDVGTNSGCGFIVCFDISRKTKTNQVKMNESSICSLDIACSLYLDRTSKQKSQVSKIKTKDSVQLQQSLKSYEKQLLSGNLYDRLYNKTQTQNKNNKHSLD